MNQNWDYNYDGSGATYSRPDTGAHESKIILPYTRRLCRTPRPGLRDGYFFVVIFHKNSPLAAVESHLVPPRHPAHHPHALKWEF